MDQGEEKLLALLASDVDRYFEQLVLTYQDRLYAFVLSRTHRPQAAEEIVQIALERAYHALKNYSARHIQVHRLEAWLYEITRNVLSNYRRESHTRATKLPSIPLDLADGSPHLEIADQLMEPDEEVCRREDRRELEAHVASLPEIYQKVVQLYYFENLHYREIAERLNQPVGTVKANIHRGTRLLRRAIQVHMKEVR